MSASLTRAHHQRPRTPFERAFCHQYDPAYRAGYAAGIAQQPLGSNPHDPNRDAFAHLGWRDGHARATITEDHA